jgi:hypothetical protein
MEAGKSVHDDLQILELSDREIAPLIAAGRENGDWAGATEQFRALVRRRRKELQRRFHPDVNPSEEAAERSKQVNLAADALLKHVKLGPRPQPQPQVFHQVVIIRGSWPGGWSTTTTTSSSTSWDW